MRNCTYNYWCLKCKNTNKSSYCSHCKTKKFSYDLGTRVRAPGPGNDYQLKKFLSFILTSNNTYAKTKLLYKLYCIQNDIESSDHFVYNDKPTISNIVKMFDIKVNYDLVMKCNIWPEHTILNNLDQIIITKVFKMIKQL